MMTGFIQGFTAYFDAVRLTSRYKLWGFALAPGVISILLGAVIFYGAWIVSDDIALWIIEFYPFDRGKALLETIVQVFGGVLVIVIGLLVFKHLVLALSAPFMSLLSENTEKHLGGQQPQVPFSFDKALRDLARGLTLAFRNLARELFYTLLLILIGVLLPVLSPVIAFALFGIQAYYAGFGNLDFTLERHRGIRGSIEFARSNRGLCLGNGTAFLLLLFSVVGFLFALPLGTIAATKVALNRLEA